MGIIIISVWSSWLCWIYLFVAMVTLDHRHLCVIVVTTSAVLSATSFGSIDGFVVKILIQSSSPSTEHDGLNSMCMFYILYVYKGLFVVVYIYVHHTTRSL